MKILINPNVQLFVTGHKGDVQIRWANNEPLPVGKDTVIASLIDGGGMHHNWGWVYLGSAPGKFEYQIYHETRGIGSDYAFFGYYDANSTQSNSNPSPFPEGVATADTDGGGSFVLLREPPK